MTESQVYKQIRFFLGRVLRLVLALGFIQFALFAIFSEAQGFPEIIFADRKTFLDWKWHAGGDISVGFLDLHIAWAILNRDYKITRLIASSRLSVSGAAVVACLFLTGYMVEFYLNH